jgi:hypothetical protein
MKSVLNKARRPLKVPLPGGKTLHLGLAGRGQVPDDALTRPAFKKLVEAGEIEVVDEASHPGAGDGGSTRVHESTHGHPATKGVTRRGDR